MKFIIFLDWWVFFFPSQVEIHIFEVTPPHDLPPTVWESLQSSEAKLKGNRLLYWPIKPWRSFGCHFLLKNSSVQMKKSFQSLPDRPDQPLHHNRVKIRKCFCPFLSLIREKCIAQHIHSIPSSLADREDPGHNFLTLREATEINVMTILIFIPTAVIKFVIFLLKNSHEKR